MDIDLSHVPIGEMKFCRIKSTFRILADTLKDY